jgi:hypothetical protein
MDLLIKQMDPGLHAHLSSIDSSNLFCCFRWFLVVFKREFPFESVCRLWEVIATQWAAGADFKFFVAMAILDEHRDAIVRHLLTFDELLKVFNLPLSTLKWSYCICFFLIIFVILVYK